MITYREFLEEGRLGDAWRDAGEAPRVKKAAKDFKFAAKVSLTKPLVGAAVMGGAVAAIPGAHEAVPIAAAAGAALAGGIAVVQGWPLKAATSAARYGVHRAISTARNYYRKK